MRGELMMRNVPVSSIAERRTFRLMLFVTLPKVRPTAPPVPRPTAAGRLTAKFGFATAREMGDRPAVSVLMSVAPPARPTAEGDDRPGGVPGPGPAAKA